MNSVDITKTPVKSEQGSKQPPAAGPFNKLKNTVSAIFRDVVNDPGVGFATGNHVLSWAVAGIEGIAVSAAALMLTTGLQLYKSLTGKPVFNSLYITAAANFITAASAIMQSAVIDGNVMKGMTAGTAFALWGASHIFLARREARNGQHGKVLTNPFVYSLGGNLASLQVNGMQPIPTLFVAASTLRSLFKVPDADEPVGTLRAFFKKHVTPVRLTSAAFVSGAALALINQDPTYMAAQGIWAWAAYNLDKAQNKALLPDAKRILQPKAG